MKAHVFTLFVCLMCLSARSQTIYSSPYSSYGLGIAQPRLSSFNQGMGGTGIGVQDDRNLNHVNPASYTGIAFPVTHIFETGIYLESNRLRSGDRTERKTNGNLNNMSYWFKFAPSWAATIGLYPFTSTSYNIQSTRVTGTGFETNYQYEGKGNINQLTFSNAVKLTKNLSVGLNTSFLFGSITRDEILGASDGAGGYRLENKISTNTFDFDVGVQYAFQLLRRKLVVGATFDDGVTLDGRRRFTLYNAASDTLERERSRRVSYQYPLNAGFGLGLHSKRSVWAADVSYKPWSTADLGDRELDLQDVLKVSAGYSYKGDPDGDSYWSFVNLRAGVYVQNYWLRTGSSAVNYGMALGVGFPVSDGRSSLNVNYNLDTVNFESASEIDQQVQRFTVQLVIRDIWGIKRKFD